MAEDEEIAAMMAMASALDPLDAHARKRTLQWALSRFGGDPTTDLALRTEAPLPLPVAGDMREHGFKFETFAELFSACDPRTEKEKALLAAYWIQIENSQSSFPSQALNSELKDLGHGIGNITEALTALKNERPSLALQLKKSGSSRQARKSYKLTKEGIKRVGQMIADNKLNETQR